MLNMLLPRSASVGDVYKTISVIALCKNTFSRPFMGANTIGNNQELLNVKQNATKEECNSSNELKYLSCHQITTVATFGITETKETFHIFHKGFCKSIYVIYLLEYLPCRIRFVRESETLFCVRLNNQRKAVKYFIAIKAKEHFCQLEPRLP